MMYEIEVKTHYKCMTQAEVDDFMAHIDRAAFSDEEFENLKGPKGASFSSMSPNGISHATTTFKIWPTAEACDHGNGD